jgi:hypothetical protein
VKKWPKDPTEAISAEKAVAPIVEIIRQGYSLRRLKKVLNYGGYDIGESEKTGCFSPDEQFEAKNLQYQLEHQGRDLLEMALMVCFQLGIEQGRRLEAATHKFDYLKGGW